MIVSQRKGAAASPAQSSRAVTEDEFDMSELRPTSTNGNQERVSFAFEDEDPNSSKVLLA